MPQANATVKIIGVDMFVGSNTDFTASLIQSVNEKESFQKNNFFILFEPTRWTTYSLDRKAKGF